jgi:alkylation response protein AidB-like acyl-CoA dehydrogenase
VDFRYTDEQLALQDTLRRWIERDYDFERRRSLARSPEGYSTAAWAQYAELGLLGLPFPEEFGGLGGSGVDIMAVMELVGEGLLLEPYWSTVVLCGGLIRDCAPRAMQAALLPEITAGRLQLALAAYESGGRYDLAHVDCMAMRAGDGWRLSGQKAVVLDAPSANYFVVAARAATGDAGIALFLVPRTAPGLSLVSYPTQSGSRAGDLRLVDVLVADDALVSAPGEGLAALERAADLGIAALCAEALGIVTALNKATLGYLKSRKQFGAPIGTFQALQHRMAELYIAGEQIRSMTIVAAVNCETRDAAARRRAMSGAKAYIGEAARFVGQQAVQLHGAMGLVDEFIVGHYFKRLTVIDLCLGDAEFHLARYSDSLAAA